MSTKSGIHIKESHKGYLHKDLGIAEGKKLTSGDIERGLHSKDPKVRKRANFAKVARSWHHGR